MKPINENSLVEKSRFLLGMKAPNYELGELKILDTYLARINARDPKTQAVTFTKEEYEHLMGFTDSRPETLKKRTEGLLGKIVTIPFDDGKKGWRKFTLFTKAECIQDDYGGYVVNLSCNPELQPIFFNVEEVGYLRYRLKNILPLTSKYSVLLYLFFKDNIFRSPFEIPLKDFREKLGVSKNKTYESFKYFKRDILDKCIEEINHKTDLTVSYSRKTRGRLTIGLVFTVKSNTADIELLPEDLDDHILNTISESDEEQMQFEAFSESSETQLEAERIDFFRSALKGNGKELSDAQVDQLQSLARGSEFANTIHALTIHDFDLKLHSYIMAQDRYVRAYCKKPSGYFNYMKGAIKENYAEFGV